MARTMTHYAEPAPTEPRDHADFEVFIYELDAGRVPPLRIKSPSHTTMELRLDALGAAAVSKIS